MWLKLLTLMVVTVTLSSVGLSDAIDVFLGQSQEPLQVFHGSSLTLYCCLRIPNANRFWIKWYFNMSVNISGNLVNKTKDGNSNETLDQDPKKCRDKDMAFSLSRVNGSHSGNYSCEVTVDIPNLIEQKSTATQIIVCPVEPSLLGKWWIWTILGVLSTVVLILLVICVLKRRKWSRKRVEEPIYANTHSRQPSPQPRMPADNMKAASTYQNLRTQRYARKANTDKWGHK
ncbi:uncharacterized protein LOC115381492 isoform X2 [Salarias fasciatus]|uniref:uncharacterized protein LOC115381492 isoform X2 n=1 Tax=Salarias fasciatus TaxID=181472 RepID=UPI001176B4D5|nr:uncharacterized protein LOC115381492 isoform X2 [Salarias fasciatus]